ncbi:trypsin-like serine protease [Halomonas coralii]|uniref:trypsin-like serine protease n=1 Tax=Modicisalibacter sp. R2A 31.J TaxID=2831898 RepID=UPI001CCD1ECB|nr:trypsin-like serine protease [Modicisalibacter sp. R2A 31.J]MBZ9557603.1 trypsin-like serine protease [Modicisalibacter sp. R2A 31.J]
MTTVTRYTNSFTSTPGDGYDGVGEVLTSAALGTGTLLANGRAVLTAAHVVENNVGPIRVDFTGVDGAYSATVSDYWINPGYSTTGYRDDLALLWLDETAPASIPRYELYRDQDELGRVATLVGYGATGSGYLGYDSDSGGQRSVVQNRLETTWDAVDDALYGNSWYTPPGSQLVADFDSGSARYDTLGYLMGLDDTGLGSVEGMIAPGDSGGPAFIDGKLAGVASYSASLTGAYGQSLDATDDIDSSYGEVGAWQRVSHYQDWIDSTLAGVSDTWRGEDQIVHLLGGGGRDLLLGHGLDDRLSGAGGNDRLYGKAGDDRLDGGAGVDVARFDVRADEATLAQGGGDSLIVASEASGRDTLTDIELLRFDDRILLTEAPGLSGPADLAFDERLYLDANPDIAAAAARGEITALDHYRDYGAHEGRDPNALFDERGYRAANPDVDAAIQRGELDSGYQHYQAWGWQEGRDPSAWFDLDAYFDANPDIAQAGVEPLGHYLRYGYDEGRVIPTADDGMWG